MSWFLDHLGSIVRVTDGAGTLLEGMDYGPFGERRGYVDPRGLPTFPQATNRGFTGHEMLDGLDIVHMNGRIYDSRIARFLQPDPIIQEPGNPQNFNRYTYLWNNPLNGTDPSGYLGVSERQWLGVIITILAVATQQYWAAGFTEAYAVGYTALVYAGVGAASGAISTQSWSGAAWGAFSGLVFGGLGGHLQNASPWVRGLSMGSAGGVLSVMQGGKFGHGFVSAGVGAALGPKIGRIGNDVGRTVVAALVGGTVSAATGGKFANGAATAVLANAFGRALAREGRGSFTETPNPELGGKASAAAAAALDEQGLLNQVYSASDLRIAVDRWRGVVVPIAEKYQVEISALLTDLGDAFTIAPPHSNGMKSAVFPLEGPRSPHVGKLMGFVHTHPFSSVLSDHDIGTAWQMAQGRNAAPKVYAFAVTRESVGVWDSVDRVPQENW